MDKSQTHIFVRDASFAVLSQVVSLVSGFVLSFRLPKYIPVINYGYWQLFILYTGYVGFLHLGFNDGIYLKLGGEKFDTIDRAQLYPAMSIMFLQQVLFSVLLLVFALAIEDNPVKKSLFAFLSFYIVIDNVYKLMSFILMATGRVNFYSRTVILDKVLLLSFIFIILIVNPSCNVAFLIGAFVFAHFVVLAITSKQFKTFFSVGISNLQDGKKLYIDCVKVGAILLFSNLCSTFIIGSGRFVIEHFWDIEVFAKVSLALTLSAFLLFFVSQISYVIFPYLRNFTQEQQTVILDKATFVLTVLAIIGFSAFFPLYYVVKNWLPQYAECLPFLIILAPLSFYDIKTNLLYNTYFKNLNKVKTLFVVNFSILISANIGYWLFATNSNINGLVTVMLAAVIMKSLVMEVLLFRYYKLSIHKATYMELITTIALIISYNLWGMEALLVCYIVMLLLFFVLNREGISSSISYIKKMRKK